MAQSGKFDEYKLFIEDTGRFAERRQTISNRHLALNISLLATIGLLVKGFGSNGTWILLLPLPLVVAGIFVSLWWGQLIRKYKELVKLRIDMLREMEDEIPDSVRMYHKEDKLYPRDEKGKMIRGKGLNFSDLEARLPWLFIVLYGIFGIVLFWAFWLNLIF